MVRFYRACFSGFLLPALLPFSEAYLVSVAVFPVFRVNKRELEEANE